MGGNSQAQKLISKGGEHSVYIRFPVPIKLLSRNPLATSTLKTQKKEWQNAKKRTNSPTHNTA